MINVFISVLALVLAIATILIQQFPAKPAYVIEMYRRIDQNAEEIKNQSEAIKKAKRNVDEMKRTQANLTKSMNNLRKEKAKKVKRK